MKNQWKLRNKINPNYYNIIVDIGNQLMEPSFQITEDSRSIMQFLKPSKSEIIQEKRQSKLLQKQKRIRKNSTQLSLFGWLVKNRPKQNCPIVHLQKDLIINVYSYLRIYEIISISQTCFYFYQCARSIWNDSSFFKQLQTDKLSSLQLRKIFEKGGKMGHVKQLRSIYMGKNLKSCRQKIKLKVQDTINNPLKSAHGNLLEVFEVTTKVQKSSAFLMDHHLQEVISSSFRSLMSLKLHSCRYIRKFYDISKCTQLASLSITQNSYLSNEDMRVITKNCSKIEYLDISGCDGLDQGIFKHISKFLNLKVLIFNNNQQPLGDLQSIKILTSLTEISLENSCIIDIQGIQIIRQLQGLKVLNINGCQLLTDFFLSSVISRCKKNMLQLKLNKTKFSESILNEWQKINKIFSQPQN